MVSISRAWHNGSYTMTAKAIKSLELHYTMIQFLIIFMMPKQGPNQTRGDLKGSSVCYSCQSVGERHIEV